MARTTILRYAKYNEEIKNLLKFKNISNGISLKFEDSKNLMLLQLTDNICSIINKLFKESIKSYQKNNFFEKTDEWCLAKLSKILKIMNNKNLNIFLCMDEKVMIYTLKYDFNDINFNQQKFKYFYNSNYNFKLDNLENLTADFWSKWK